MPIQTSRLLAGNARRKVTLRKHSQDERPDARNGPGRKPEEGTTKGKVLVGKYLSCGVFVGLDTACETMPAHV
jgi:hypothetical protein